ncbi:MAG: hypothetical protein GXY64_10720 [Bacteroidales bacterium]|nr:hypothetical protein [Bacteroidales bacterium]
MNNIQVVSAQDKVEKISKITLWVLVGISILITILFALINFDRPYEDNPDMVDPQLTDLLIVWTYILIASAAISTVGAAIYGYISGGNKSKNEDIGLASKAGVIAWGTFLVGIVAGLIAGIANKDEMLIYNTNDQATPSELIITDTSMIAIIVLTVVSVIVTAYSMVSNKK